MSLNLLVSKINNIRVIQVDESELSFDNKKADSKKPSKSKGLPSADASGGENTTVDLGAGALKHTIKVFTFSDNEADTLFNILYNERYCDITDKFFGKLKVYIDGVKKTSSDKHIGKTIFVINATVQDKKKTPKVNTKAQLENTTPALKNEIATATLDLIDNISTTDTFTDTLTLEESFFDSSLATTEKGLKDIMDISTTPASTVDGIKAKVNRTKRITDTLKLATQLPTDVLKLSLDMTDTQTSKPAKIHQAETKAGRVVNSVDEDFSELPQIEVVEIKKIIIANKLLNLIIVVGEINQVLIKEYKSQQEFDEQVNICLDRLEVLDISYEQKHITQQALKAHSNNQKLKKVIDYEVKEETPLTSITFNLYGNLDNYNEIKTLNNFADNDAVVGTIKVYNDSVN